MDIVAIIITFMQIAFVNAMIITEFMLESGLERWQQQTHPY